MFDDAFSPTKSGAKPPRDTFALQCQEVKVGDSVLSRLEASAQEIIETSADRAKKVMVAFSAGKDAIVAAALAAEHGLSTTLVMEASFTFKQQREDGRRIADQLGCELIERHHLKTEWLAEHPEYLFTGNHKLLGQFYYHRQQRSMAEFAAAEGYDGVVFGRRAQENTVPSTLYKVGRGSARWHIFPIRQWKHEHVWAFMRRRGIDVPWVYSTPMAKVAGNAGWSTGGRIWAGDPPNYEAGWAGVYQYDYTAVEEAAEHIESARRFLENRRKQ